MEVRPRKKILALHGVAQSGPVFAKRISTIANTLTPLGYDFVFISGPCDIAGTPYIIARQEDWKPGDLERSWWETDDTAGTHAGVETAMELWGRALKEHGLSLVHWASHRVGVRLRASLRCLSPDEEIIRS